MNTVNTVVGSTIEKRRRRRRQTNRMESVAAVEARRQNVATLRGADTRVARFLETFEGDWLWMFTDYRVPLRTVRRANAVMESIRYGVVPADISKTRGAMVRAVRAMRAAAAR